MRASSILIEKLKKMEGCRMTAYQDTAGVWTIGYGHTAGVKRGDRCTQYQAEQYLREDLAKFEAKVQKYKNLTTQGRFDAVLDFCYNLGCAKYEGSTLRKKIEAWGKTADIQREFLKWVYAGGKVLDGLYSRRIWEAARFSD